VKILSVAFLFFLFVVLAACVSFVLEKAGVPAFVAALMGGGVFGMSFGCVIREK